MSTAIEEMRSWQAEAEHDFDMAMSKGGKDFRGYEESLKRAARYAAIAQAEAAERQAAAAEKANELAERAADPFKAYMMLEAAAKESAAQKDAEIARLKAELAKVQPVSGEDELGPYTRR